MVAPGVGLAVVGVGVGGGESGCGTSWLGGMLAFRVPAPYSVSRFPSPPLGHGRNRFFIDFDF